MKTIKIRFGNDFGKGEAESRKVFDEIFQSINPAFGHWRHIWRPHMDIFESPEEIIILVELAGVKMEDIHLEMGRKILKISGRRQEKPFVENGRYRLAEIPHGYFERHLTLPAPVDADTIEATHADGLLQIRMAKAPLDTMRKVSVKKS